MQFYKIKSVFTCNEVRFWLIFTFLLRCTVPLLHFGKVTKVKKSLKKLLLK